MVGLRRRVSVGFLSIAILLFVSSVIAFFELNTLSHDTKSILSVNSRKMELANQMLGIVNQHDAAFVRISLLGDPTFDSVSLNHIDALEGTVNVVANEISNVEQLDSLSFYVGELKQLVQTVVSQPILDTLSGVSRASYYDNYQPIQSKIVNSICDFTESSFKSIEPRAEQLQRNAYRAVTPMFISLVVMIVIVLLLYYFMIIYCVNPIVRLNRSLGDFITYRLPFTSKNDCNDEVKELQDKIEAITSQIRRENSAKK